MRVKIGGRTWTVEDDPDMEDFGWCSDNPAEPRIWIRAGQKPKPRLDTLIHELLHAMFPKMTEKCVRKTAGILTDGLWKDRWRRGEGKT